MRARMSASLLRLSGFRRKTNSFGVPPATRKSPPVSWSSWERTLQSAWTKQLAEQWRKPRTQLAPTPSTSRLAVGTGHPSATKIVADFGGKSSVRFFSPGWPNRYESEAQFLKDEPLDREARVFFPRRRDRDSTQERRPRLRKRNEQQRIQPCGLGDFCRRARVERVISERPLNNPANCPSSLAALGDSWFIGETRKP